MNFRRELAEAVVRGRKSVTRRAVSDNPRSPYHPDRARKMAGKRIAICPGRGKAAIGIAYVASVTRETFNCAEITLPEARREGFDTVLAFVETWLQLHDGAPVDVWRIELQLSLGAAS